MQTPSLLALALAALPAAASGAADFAFDPPIFTPLPANHTPTALRLADLDGDGLLDAVVVGRNYSSSNPDVPGRIAILKGAGNGTFTPWPDFIVGKATGEGLVLADFNGDGHVDLAATIASAQRGRAFIAPGNGDGSFGKAFEIDLERQPRGIEALDLDEDGDLDLAAVNYTSASLTMLENQGEGAFAVASTRRLHPYVHSIPYPSQLLAHDLSGDGRRDLLTTATGAGRISVHPGSGALEPVRAVDWKLGQINDEAPGLINASVADFDGDGHLDLAVTVLLVSQSQKCVFFRNDGAGGFTESAHFGVSVVGYPWSSAPIDVDGDGRIDLAVGTALGGTVSFLRNQTAGPGAPLSFAAAPPVIPCGSFVRDLVAADIDGDGDEDLVGVDIAGSTLFVLINRTGEGGAAAAQAPFEPGRITLPLPTGDRNGDGATDAIDMVIELEAFGATSKGGGR